MRDYPNRTEEWLQGKTFEASTPFGPVLVTTDEFGFGDLRTTVNGELKQHASVLYLRYKMFLASDLFLKLTAHLE